MSFDDFDDTLTDQCRREHHRPEEGCESCGYRRTLQHCGLCDATFEDGQWFTGIGSTTPNGCDHETITDDWGRELRCTVITSSVAHPVIICGDRVTTGGKWACDWHQGWLDAEEMVHIYERLVAVGSLPR